MWTFNNLVYLIEPLYVLYVVNKYITLLVHAGSMPMPVLYREVPSVPPGHYKINPNN